LTGGGETEREEEEEEIRSIRGEILSNPSQKY
jgi:hypothetical protein